MRSIHRFLAEQGLVRDTSDKILGGVCSGLARKFGVDAWAVRLLVIAALILLPGSQILIYPLAWFLMPDEARANEVRQPQAPAGTLNTSNPNTGNSNISNPVTSYPNTSNPVTSQPNTSYTSYSIPEETGPLNTETDTGQNNTARPGTEQPRPDLTK